jgi:hypothetical protein
METANAPANYVYNFYFDIENLSVQTANYLNNLLDFKTKYANLLEEDLKKVPENDKEIIMQCSRNCRFWIMRSYVHFLSLAEKISAFAEKKTFIEEKYNELIQQNPIEYHLVQNYLIELNKLFVQGIAQKELKDAIETYSKLNAGEWSGTDGTQ